MARLLAAFKLIEAIKGMNQRKVSNLLTKTIKRHIVRRESVPGALGQISNPG